MGQAIGAALVLWALGWAAPGAEPIRSPGRPAAPVLIDSAGLDALIDRSVAAARGTPARLTTDEEFARRLYLDLTGLPPTVLQLHYFLSDPSPDKRARLIDFLLASPQSARHWARFWRDVLKYRAPNGNGSQMRWPVFEDWMADQIARNVPWDRVTTTILTANGRTDQYGPANFAMGQVAGTEVQTGELAGAVSQAFLGIQIQCAECHDHPTDSWKREQFHEFAAYFAGLRARVGAPVLPKPKPKFIPFELYEDPPGSYAMPDLKDPKVAHPVRPRFFLFPEDGPAPEGLTIAQRRALIASYITRRDNPWFARAFVNRIWYALMGEPFTDRVDDMGPNSAPRSPEILEALAVNWQERGYDVRWLLRTVLNTRAYQRLARTPAASAGGAPFVANLTGPLRPDPLFNSLAEVLNLPYSSEGAEILRVHGIGSQQKGHEMLRGLFNSTFGFDPATPTDEVMATIPQTLVLMNNPVFNGAVQARPGTVLGEILAAHPNDLMALDALYLRALSRHPTPQEAQVAFRYLRAVGRRNEAFEDIFWCLINSAEFAGRH